MRSKWEEWLWKRRDTDRHTVDWQYTTWPYAPLNHRFTGDGRVLWPQTTPWGRQTPSTNWL